MRGRVGIQVRARAEIEQQKKGDRQQIVVTEIPYQVNKKNLLERIAQGEGKDLEFKRGLPRDEKTARTLCAFANTRGGLLLVGVGDRGEIPRSCPARSRR